MTEALKLSAITHEIAAAHIQTFAREERLEQGKWHGKGGDGREIACLLGSIHPKINDAEDCPAALMPRWLARLTVRLFDGIPRGRIFAYGEAYAARLHQWGAFDAAAWERVRTAFIREPLEGVVERAQARMGDRVAANWPHVKSLLERLQQMLLNQETPWRAYGALRDEAYVVRNEAWNAWNVARKTEAEAAAEAAEAVSAVSAVWAGAAAAEAAAVSAVSAVWAGAAAAEAAAAEAVSAVSAVWAGAAGAAGAAAEAEAQAAAAAEAEAARRDSYAASFDTLLRVIDRELATVQ